MIKLQSRKKVAGRRLRIEILETRSLLSAAPWMLIEPDETPIDSLLRVPGDDFFVGKQPGIIARNAQHGRDRLDHGPQSHGPRGPQQSPVLIGLRLQPEDMRLAPPHHGAGNSQPVPREPLGNRLAPLPPPAPLTSAVERLAQRNDLQRNDLVSAADLLVTFGSIDRVILDLGGKSGSTGPRPTTEIEMEPARRVTVVFFVTDELAADIAQNRDSSTRPMQALAHQASGTRAVDQLDLLAKAATGATGVVLQSSGATPRVTSSDVVTFEYDSPAIQVDPLATFEGSKSTFQSFGKTRFQADDLADASNRSFDFALKNLFLEADRLGTLQDLDKLLESLAQEHRTQNGLLVEQPAASETLRPWSSASNDDSGWDEATEAMRPQASNQYLADAEGGMIALQLPDDVLIANSDLIGRELRDQPSAWTARIGLYRAHELASANAGSATMIGPTNLPAALDLSQRAQLGDSIVASRLRPIVAATSVALGAIFLNRRKRRELEPSVGRPVPRST